MSSDSEKETLVREIHHRVKNHLQLMVSLLGMQSRQAGDANVIAAFEAAQGRLRAIAQVHEHLYASQDLTEVEFGGYVTGLANELVQLHSRTRGHITLRLEIADMVLHIERAIPVGLIANELIVNSLKHGLGENPGRLFVKLAYLPGSGSDSQSLDSGWAQLQVADTGHGLPVDFDPGKTESMGLCLVRMMIRQLRGRLDIGEGPGANVSVSFPIENVDAAHSGAST